MVKNLSLALICLAYSSHFALGAVIKQSSSEWDASELALASHGTSIVNHPTSSVVPHNSQIQRPLSLNITEQYHLRWIWF